MTKITSVIKQQPKLTGQIGNTLIYVDPDLEDVKVDIVENGTYTLRASEGYDALNSVEVTTDITDDLVDELDTYSSEVNGQESELANIAEDLRLKVLVSKVPEKCFIVHKWNDNGFPVEIELRGVTDDTYNFGQGSSGYQNALTKYLEKVTINSTITTIPQNWFGYCTALKEVVLPDSITAMSYGAFINCSNLTSVKLPSRLLRMNGYAFHQCEKLEIVKLPDTLTAIGDYDFFYCKNLNLEKLPESLTSIGEQAFRYSGIKIKTLPDGIDSIGSRLFQYCTKLVQLSMPNVSSISGGATGTGAFKDCSKLAGVWIGSSIEGIGSFAFMGCYAIKKMFIDLPRATVEAMTGYAQGFSNGTIYTSKIICNDDEGFMTQEEFDAIDWATYEEA